jgi:hypothetical protein
MLNFHTYDQILKILQAYFHKKFHLFHVLKIQKKKMYIITSL